MIRPVVTNCSSPNRMLELVSLPVMNVPSAPISGAKAGYNPPVVSARVMATEATMPL